MNRWLVIAAVLGLSVAGCAVSVDDPVPEPPAPTPQKPPPAQQFSGDLQDQVRIEQLGKENALPNVAPRQRPPGVPMENVEQIEPAR